MGFQTMGAEEYGRSNYGCRRIRAFKIEWHIFYFFTITLL